MRFIKKFWNWSQPGVPDAPLEVKIFALVAWPFGIASFLIMLYGLVILTNHIVDRIVPPPSEVYVENIKSAIVKYNAEDYLGAIEDLTIAIKIKPDFAAAYNVRGSAKVKLGQSSAGCLDWNKAGELGNEKAYDLFKEYCQ